VAGCKASHAAKAEALYALTIAGLLALVHRVA